MDGWVGESMTGREECKIHDPTHPQKKKTLTLNLSHRHTHFTFEVLTWERKQNDRVETRNAGNLVLSSGLRHIHPTHLLY